MKREIHLRADQITDFINLGKGVYHPLDCFQGSEDLESMLAKMKTISGEIWPIPIILDVKNPSGYSEGTILDVLTKGRTKIGTLELFEIYKFDKEEFCKSVFGTTDSDRHPGVKQTFEKGDYLFSGKVNVSSIPSLNQFSVRFPTETKKDFKEKGWKTVVGFQTRNPPHRGHEYILKLALKHADGVSISPILGHKKDGDFRDKVIISAYEALIKNYFPKNKVSFNPILLNMKYAGPKEAILHAIIRRNYGCTHFIVGRDHAGAGNFYGPYDAQNIFNKFDVGIKILKYTDSFYCSKCDSYSTGDLCPHSPEYRMSLSGSRLRELLMKREPISTLFVRKEVLEVFKNTKNLFVGA